MGSGHRFNEDMGKGMRAGVFKREDPGDGFVLEVGDRGRTEYYIDTAGSESRSFPNEDNCAIGQELFVVFNSDGGNFDMTNGAAVLNMSSHSVVTFADEGDWALFKVLQVDGSKSWRLIDSDGVSLSA